MHAPPYSCHLIHLPSFLHVMHVKQKVTLQGLNVAVLSNNEGEAGQMRLSRVRARLVGEAPVAGHCGPTP